jgi:hypothetical protein
MLEGEIRGQGLARSVLSTSKWSGHLGRIQEARNTDGTLPSASRPPPNTVRSRPTCYVDGQFK